MDRSRGADRRGSDDDGVAGVTGRDIAARLRISQSTVSRALRRDPKVAASTMRKVIETAERLHYTPHITARNLITRRSTTIGVVVSDIKNPFYPELVDILHNEFAIAGYRTVLLNERTDAHLERHVVEVVAGHAVDGIVYTSAELDTPLVGAARTRLPIPVVLLNRTTEDERLDAVVSDNRAGGRLAARALLDHGHRRIAFIGGPDNTSTSRDREHGVIAELADAGLPLAPQLRRRGAYSHESGYQFATELLSLDAPPTAVVCANDVIAFGVLDAARRLAIAVPDDLSVIGFDNIEMAAWEGFALTTIEQRLAEMARTAAQMLLTRIHAERPDPGRVVRFPVRIVERTTVGAVPSR